MISHSFLIIKPALLLESLGLRLADVQLLLQLLLLLNVHAIGQDEGLAPLAVAVSARLWLEIVDQLEG